MANNVDIKEKQIILREENAASRESSFYTLSNRIILPLGFINLPIMFFEQRLLILLGAVIIIEIVLRYIMKTTLRGFIVSMWRKVFGTERKSVRN